MPIILRVTALFAVITLAACGSNSATPAPPTVVPTNPRQVVLRSTLPPETTNKRLRLPTPNPKVTPKALPTLVPAPTMTSIPSSDYTAVVFGSVLDQKTNSPVAGALVTIGTGQRSGRTSPFGAYKFTFPAGVAMPVTVSATGYVGALAMGRLRPHQRLKLNFKLTRIIPGKVPVPPAPTTFGHP